MNRLVKKTLENRGYTEEFLNDINCADHDVLKDSDILCQRLRSIFEAKKHLVIIPDFDMDGIMSGVVGFAGLAELGFNVSLFIPNPLGYSSFKITRLPSSMAS